MRIKDLAIVPFEIEANSTGYTLYKMGIVEAEGANKGCRKETVWGYYNRHQGSVETMFEKIVFEKVVDSDSVVTLNEFLKAYAEEFKIIHDRLEKIFNKMPLK